MFTTSASFTRPNDTTAYADEDLVANSTTAGSVSPMAFNVGAGALVRRVRLLKSVATATNANFTLYLFASSPTVANGDNGAISPIAAGLFATVALDMTGSIGTDDCIIFNNLTVPLLCTGTVYGLLKAEAAYTPGALEVFTVALDFSKE